MDEYRQHEKWIPRGFAFLFPHVLLLLFFTASIRAAETPAWKEQITTPHWIARRPHSGGTVRALFLTNDLALHDPEELAERFDLNATVVPTTGGDAYKNNFDLHALTAGLQQKPDVLVVSVAFPWRDLGPAGCTAIATAVTNGLPLVIFSRTPPADELYALFQIKPEDRPTAKKEKVELFDAGDMELDAEDAPAAPQLPFQLPAARTMTKDLAGSLPLSYLFPGNRVPPLKILAIPAGKGMIYHVTPYDRHFTFFHAFLPHCYRWEMGDVLPEIAYLLAARIIRQAAGREVAPASAKCQLGPVANQEAEFAFRLPFVLREKKIAWQIRSWWGQPLASGITPRPTENKALLFPFPHTGRFFFLWQSLDARDRQVRSGILPLRVRQPIHFDQLTVPERLARGDGLTISWTLSAAPKTGDQVVLQVYNPDRLLIREARAVAGKKILALSAWQLRGVNDELRLLLLRGKTILDEKRRILHVAADPQADQRRWHTIVWGAEQGFMGERWRYDRLRQLGITAMATLGTSPGRSLAADAYGLRVLPTNVFVPKNRFNNKKFSVERAEKRLESLVQAIAPLSPLAYSLADEPAANVLLPWRERAEKIIRRYDPDARIGYCGLWVGAQLPALLRTARFSTPYSPLHLYDVNLWRGIERDLYRSFRRPDSLLTCWTHYAPWADNEPYSRSAPWVWLFEELNGVSYFQSAQNFGVIKGDLRTTHETRWWSEEIHEISAGIGEQILRMKREHGVIRILFNGDVSAVTPWARVLNQQSIPYRFVDAGQGTVADFVGARLVIAVNTCPLGPRLQKAIRSLLDTGGILVAGNGFALGKDEQQDDFCHSVFNFSRPQKTPAAYKKAVAPLRDIRVSTTLPAADGTKILLTGQTTGEQLAWGNDAATMRPFDRIGDLAPTEKKRAPRNLIALFSAAAIRIGSNGQAFYLAFQPSADSIRAWLPSLLQQAKIAMPAIRLLATHKQQIDPSISVQSPTKAPRNKKALVLTGKPEDRVYLYRFAEGDLRVVGMVPDYIRIPPVERVASPKPKQTRAYFQHGPRRWAYLDSILTLGGKPAHLYDLRRGKYLGFVDHARLRLLPGQPRLFALLPYVVNGLMIDGKKQARAGTDYAFRVQLKVTGGQVGNHVVHIRLLDPQGRAVPPWSRNLHAIRGQASARWTLPAGLTPGRYQLIVRDILSSVQAQQTINLTAPDPLPAKPLLRRTIQVSRQPRAWPAGLWQKISNPRKKTGAWAKVGKITEKRAASGKFSGRIMRQTQFSLGNALRHYTLKYLVCHDPKAYHLDDPRRVLTINGYPGLGITQPRGHLWYYNGYIDIKLDEMKVTNYALTNIRDISHGKIAGIELRWDTPKAEVVLEYAMEPGNEGLFQRLTILPHRPIAMTTVHFFSYPAGYGNGKAFIEIDPEHQSWMLMGDAIRDRAFYESGGGSAGLLVQREQWQKIKFNARPLLIASRDPAEQKKTWSFSWIQWIFPKRSNAAALTYMRTQSADVKTRLATIFPALPTARTGSVRTP